MKAPRALDPATHLPYPELDWKWKMANFFLEKWGRKGTLKLLQILNPFINVVVGYLAHTPESSQLIGSAIGAAVLGGIDLLVSWLTHGRVPSLQRIQEDAEMDEAPTTIIAPQFTETVRPQVAPSLTWVLSWKEPGDPDFTRKPYAFERLKAIEAYEALKTNLSEGSYCFLSNPGELLPTCENYKTL